MSFVDQPLPPSLDNFVQVRDDKKCVVQFNDLWAYITSPGNTQLKRKMLAFTNDKENPAMFGEDGKKLQYEVPDPVKHIDSFTIVSTMAQSPKIASISSSEQPNPTKQSMDALSRRQRRHPQ